MLCLTHFESPSSASIPSVSIEDLCWCCNNNNFRFEDVLLGFGVIGELMSEQLKHVPTPLLSESMGNTCEVF